MPNAQKWINKKYPQGTRNEVKELSISYKDLVAKEGLRERLLGSLDLTDFVNLEVLNIESNKLTSLNLSGLSSLKNLNCKNNKLTELNLTSCHSLAELDCDGNKKLTSLETSELINLKKLDCGFNQLTNLDLSKCLKLTELICSNNHLTDLKIIDLPHLIELNCSNNWLSSLKIVNCLQLSVISCINNKLTELEIINCPQLWEFSCMNNYLTEFRFNNLSPESLVYLNVSNNNFSEQNLTCFRKFINLTHLMIGSSEEEKIAQNIFNRFTGSLESLKELTKLEYLDIDNTNVNGGLEYLSDTCESIDCQVRQEHSPIAKIRASLEAYQYNFKNWKRANQDLVAKAKKADELSKQLEQAQENFVNALQAQVHQYKEKIRILEEQLQKAQVKITELQTKLVDEKQVAVIEQIN